MLGDVCVHHDFIIVPCNFTVNRVGGNSLSVFSERFKELKSKNSLTYPAIAERLGIGARAVKKYASGEGKPDYDGLLSLSDLFDVSLDYLVGRSDDPARR